MILAQNPLRQLSGNKFLLLLVVGAFFAACSPKVTSVKVKPDAEKKKEVNEEKKVDKKFTEATVSLLLPFKLNQINLKSATKADLEESAMAINFYQALNLELTPLLHHLD